MKIFTWDDILNKSKFLFSENTFTGISVGCFDGLHRGHKKLIENLIQTCKADNLFSGIITFSNMAKKSKMESQSIFPENDFSYFERFFPNLDFCIIIDFTSDFAHLSGEEFFNLLKNKINLKYLVEGVDFRCGYKGLMGQAELKNYCDINHIKSNFLEPVYDEVFPENRISSSLIRQFISDGNIFMANKMLGYNFSLDLRNINPSKNDIHPGYRYNKNEINQILPKNGKYNILTENKKQSFIIIDEKYIYIENKADFLIFD